ETSRFAEGRLRASEGIGASERTRDDGNKVRAKVRAASRGAGMRPKAGIGFFSMGFLFVIYAGAGNGFCRGITPVFHMITVVKQSLFVSLGVKLPLNPKRSSD
ncbi:MAG TPA: hypothetical protein DEF45_14655, partial [Rhodopirellula sp.]|nr:hypothetical protein [Rhodopirellula sp.]